MRHAIAGNTLNRKTAHRKATVRDIAKATLLHQRITTTKAKAKEARKMVEKLITLGKSGTLSSKRRAFSVLNDHALVSRLFNRTSPLFKSRNGGYTRIILLDTRSGDNAQMCFLELTEKEEIIVSTPKSTAAAKKDKVKATKKESKEKAEPQRATKAEVAKSEKAEAAEPEERQEKETPKQPVKDMKQESRIKGDKSMDKLSGIRKFFRRKTT
jgi:large subunit ribosomal protein L17